MGVIQFKLDPRALANINNHCIVSAHCERLSSAKGVPRRSSWSPPHLLDRRMEEHAMVGDWESLGEMEGQTNRARSKSVGFHEHLEVHEVHDEDLPTRVTSSVPNTLDSNDGGGSHAMEQKTILKSEKCGLCGERMKFGKVGLRCSECRLSITSLPSSLTTFPLNPTMIILASIPIA